MKRIPILLFAFSELDPKVQSMLIEEMRPKSFQDDWYEPVIDRFYKKLGEYADDPTSVEVSFDMFGDKVHFGINTRDLVRELDAEKLFDLHLAERLDGLAKYFSWKFFADVEQDYKLVGYFFMKGDGERMPLWRTSPSYALKPQLTTVRSLPTFGETAQANIDDGVRLAFEAWWRDLMNLCRETYKELVEEYEFQTSDQVIIDKLVESEGVAYTKEGFMIMLRGDEHQKYEDENRTVTKYVVLNTANEGNPQLVTGEEGSTMIFYDKKSADDMLDQLVSGQVLPLDYLLQTGRV